MIVKAEREHIDWIVRHRVEMFRSMGMEESDLSTTEKVARDFLQNDWDLQNPTIYLVREGKEIVGGCAVAYYQVLPDTRNPSGMCAYILNMFVEPESRGRGLATTLVNQIKALCEKHGINKLALHDTEMSKRIYEREGFVKSKNYYELLIKKKMGENPH